MNKVEKNNIRVLGSGTSTGVPTLGCECEVCRSLDTKDKRLRSSIYLTTGRGTKILIDAGPDLRQQFMMNDLGRPDSCIITHDHADHLHGIDDLRPFCFTNPPSSIPIYTHEETAEHMRIRFPYIFNAEKLFTKDRPILGGGIPRLDLSTVKHMETKIICGEEFTFYLLPHGYTRTLGFVHHKFAYFIDCKTIPKDVIADLKNRQLDLLLIDCLREKAHDTHLHRELAFKFIQEIGPKEAGLIHMSHDWGHAQLAQICSDHFDFPVFPTYDQQNLSYRDA
jgi:phosphoribosyl 1,2-cyclic phosphate phosphodiesterase